MNLNKRSAIVAALSAIAAPLFGKRALAVPKVDGGIAYTSIDTDYKNSWNWPNKTERPLFEQWYDYGQNIENGSTVFRYEVSQMQSDPYPKALLISAEKAIDGLKDMDVLEKQLCRARKFAEQYPTAWIIVYFEKPGGVTSLSIYFGGIGANELRTERLTLNFNESIDGQ